MIFIKHIQEGAGADRLNLAVTLKISGDFIGMIGYRISGTSAELAYMIAPKHWRKGYATEAAKRLIQYAFENTQIDCICARSMTDNTASETVLTRVGLRRQYEALVELPLRSGRFLTSFWRLSRADYESP